MIGALTYELVKKNIQTRVTVLGAKCMVLGAVPSAGPRC